MNNYVLIAQSDKLGYYIDSVEDDLSKLNERLKYLKGLNKIKSALLYTLNDLTSGKIFITEEIKELANSMSKFKFYPIYKVKSIDDDNIKFLTYVMGTSLDMNYVKSEIESSMKHILSRYQYINNTVEDNDCIHNVYKGGYGDLNHKVSLSGVESWLFLPTGWYVTRDEGKSKEYYFSSFLDYIQRHKGYRLGNKVVDSSENDMILNTSCIKCDYLNIMNKRCNSFPLMDSELLVSSISDVEIRIENGIVYLIIN